MKRTTQQLSLAVVLATAALLGVGRAEAAPITVSSDITTSTTWTAGNVYTLTQIIYVRNGATLTIEPGTLIRAENESAPAAGDSGVLCISRGAKINAVGTPANPIIFTDLNDDQVPGGAASNSAYQQFNQTTGKWGGLIICGRTFIGRGTSATGPSATADNQVEGLTASTYGRYGGTIADPANDDDDSGTVRYVQLRYGGEVIGAANEVNGLTLGAVGRKTVIDHVEIFNNVDDGVEFFGGTVNTKYMIVWANGDDGFDMDFGFRGKGQFWFLVQGDCGGSVGSKLSDKAIEDDTSDVVDADQPYSIPTVCNATFIGLGGSASDVYTTKARNSAFHFKNNGRGRFYNCVVLDWGGAGVLAEQEGGAGAINSAQGILDAYTAYSAGPFPVGFPNTYFYQNASYPVGANQLDVDQSVWFQSSAGWANITPSLAADVATAGGQGSGVNGGSTASALFGGGNANTVSTAASMTDIITAFSRVSGVVNRPRPVSSIDPRPAGSSPLLGNTFNLSDGFFTPVTFKGAFSAQNNWAKGWTLIDRLGYLPAFVNPTEPTPGLTLLSQISFATANGVSYSVEASDDMRHWTPLTVIVGDGTTKTYVDTRTLATRQFYRVNVL